MRLASIILLILCLSSPLQAQKAPTPVIVTEASRQPFVDKVEALGTLRANESVDLSATATEVVTAIHFEDGERVEAGKLLLELDAAEELADLNEAESTLQEARQQYERAKNLAKKGVASQSLLDEERGMYRAAQARVRSLKSRIENRRIHAPFSGVLGIRTLSLGALVEPGTLITTLDDDRIMKLDFSVPSVFLPHVQKGQTIDATSKAFPGRRFTGTIASIDSRINPTTRAFQLRALIENEDRTLKHGLLMQVVLRKNPRERIILPEETLIQRGQKSYVYVLTSLPDGGQTVEQREVTLGSRRQGEVEVLSGVSEGEQIVTHGTLRARPGQPVSVSTTQENGDSVPQLLDRVKGEADDAR